MEGEGRGERGEGSGDPALQVTLRSADKSQASSARKASAPRRAQGRAQGTSSVVAAGAGRRTPPVRAAVERRAREIIASAGRAA